VCSGLCWADVAPLPPHLSLSVQLPPSTLATSRESKQILHRDQPGLPPPPEKRTAKLNRSPQSPRTATIYKAMWPLPTSSTEAVFHHLLCMGAPCHRLTASGRSSRRRDRYAAIFTKSSTAPVGFLPVAAFNPPPCLEATKWSRTINPSIGEADAFLPRALYVVKLRRHAEVHRQAPPARSPT
jgi:hypothetical protein